MISQLAIPNRRSATLLTIAIALVAAACSSSPVGQSETPSFRIPSDWSTYADQTFGFLIRMPPTYVERPQGAAQGSPVAIDAPGPGVPVDPETYRRLKDEARVHQVSFQDRGASGGEGTPESPGLAIEIFRKQPDVSLRAWLESLGAVRAGASLPSMRTAAAGIGFQVGANTWYFAGSQYIYELTIRDPQSALILSSLQLISR